MKRSTSLLGGQIALMAVLSLALVWAAAAYELYRSHQSYLHDAEVRTAVQAHVFAEYSRSTLKRINEFILDIRSDWTGDWKSFAESVRRQQENIDDLTFQVAVIDKDGILAYSNLAKPTDRTDLSRREHFRVHQDSGNADRLFISKPLKGKVSGKWSIQVTRPILHRGEFAGVLVVSVSPEEFAGFGAKLRLSGNSTITVVRNTGDVMARYPAMESSLGQVLREGPYLGPQAVSAGNFRQVSQLDGIERIYGFHGLPEYGMSFVLGEAVSDVLVPYRSHQRTVLVAALVVSVLVSSLFLVLFRSLSSLEDIRRQLAAIFALSPDGFISFDGERRVKYISPAFRRMTGLHEADLVGLDENAFAARLAPLCIEQARFSGLAAMRAAQKSGRGDAVEAGKGGHRQIIELANAGHRVLEVDIRMAEAEAVSQVLYFRDVTHETEVDRMKSEFLSTAAHELRTPMASIYGYSELMLAQEFPEEERRELIGIIHRQSELMVSIINELLDLVRIEERRGKDFKLARVEAGALLREAIANFKPPHGRAAPLAPSPDSLHWLRVDRQKLMQAVGNVLSNACKYSPDGGAVEVALVAAADPDVAAQIGIRITDHGIGMTPEQLARVCERFYRADASGKIPGTGLGMSIVKEIVELHGGHVTLASQAGSGTTVTLWLPAA